MMTRRTLLGATAALGASGCWGGFGLTKKFYDWNGTFSSKWLAWLIFLLFTIIPVYEVLLLVDALVINSIEFWTGSNPMGNTAPIPPVTEKTVEQEDGTKITFYRLDDTTMRMVRRDPQGGFLQGFEMVMEGERAGQIRNLEGEVLVTNEVLSDGTLAVTYNGQTTFVSKAQQDQVAAAKSPALAAKALLPAGPALAMR